MAKKKVEELEAVEAEAAEAPVEEAPKALARLDADFGREDLNALRDRLNEVIEALNK